MQPYLIAVRLRVKKNITPMRSTFTFILLLIAGTLSAQTKEIPVSSYSEITLQGPFKVTLVKAAKSKVEIDYRNIDPEDVVTDCSGEELEIRIRHHGLFDFDDDWEHNRKRNFATVTIYYTNLKEISISEGTSLQASETITAPRMKLKSRMGSEMKLNLQMKELLLESSMGSEVDLSGTAQDFDLKAKMGSDVDASELKCQDVRVSASMGASVRVYAENDLDASASFGATVSCKGNPKHKNTSGTFGGDFN
jgi:hypothetical protein